MMFSGFGSALRLFGQSFYAVRRVNSLHQFKGGKLVFWERKMQTTHSVHTEIRNVERRSNDDNWLPRLMVRAFCIEFSDEAILNVMAPSQLTPIPNGSCSMKIATMAAQHYRTAPATALISITATAISQEVTWYRNQTARKIENVSWFFSCLRHNDH